MQPAELIEVMRSRRSIRRYQDRPVPSEVLDALLEAARWAPSAHNRQPWRFLVIESRDAKSELAAAMGERLRADLEKDGVAAEIIEVDAARSYRRITSAPIVIVACASLVEMDHYPDEARQGHERTMAIQSAAMAVQNLLLMAHAEGLGACWMCAPLFVPDTVSRVLQLDQDWEPLALITVGYPAEKREKTRRPVTAVARFVQGADRP